LKSFHREKKNPTLPKTRNHQTAVVEPIVNAPTDRAFIAHIVDRDLPTKMD